MNQLTKNDIARFWKKVDVCDENKCWNWNGAINSSGYGSMRFNGAIWGAHRISYLIARSTIPSGLHVLHRCDNRKCVNPNHLFLGTNHDNVLDSLSKGSHTRALGIRNARYTHPETTARGETHGMTHFKESDVKEIRHLHEQGLSERQLSKRFHSSHSTIHRILKRLVWKHIP